MEIKACDYAHAIFQSALPRGERHGASVEYKPTMTTISIRAPARGATSGHQSGFSYVSISIRAPARGATKSGKHTVVYSVISIRAPARGATKSRNTSYPGLDISIRAPARGATTVSVCAEFSGSNFNPRSREGSDAWQKADWLYYQISIRAPARGATGRPCQLLYVKGFQSALPRGERLPLTRGMLQVHDFNPRSREGSDTIWSDIVSRTGISIRAPARGATTERSYLLDMDVISIRAPARGATYLSFSVRYFMTISIRAPARGATRAISPGQLYCKHFNPRSREGSDAALPPAFPLPCEFQSALPRGERLHKLRKLLL